MLAFGIKPSVIDPSAVLTASDAFVALADAAARYLTQMDEGVEAGALEPHTALFTRVRGTGPGVSFGHLVNALMNAPHQWESPFENSPNVSGAVIKGSDVVSEDRTDAFLLLQFAAGTLDLPLHIHEDSDRFIFAIGGRGFFHVSSKPSLTQPRPAVRTAAVRDRDALMFRRGTVHTFSTAGHPLILASYHRPYVPLSDERQYLVPRPPRLPSEFIDAYASRVSFDPAWSVLAAPKDVFAQH